MSSSVLTLSQLNFQKMYNIRKLTYSEILIGTQIPIFKLWILATIEYQSDTSVFFPYLKSAYLNA